MAMEFLLIFGVLILNCFCYMLVCNYDPRNTKLMIDSQVTIRNEDMNLHGQT